MEFVDRIEALSKQSRLAEQQAKTEEATKTGVVMPFLQALGFNVFNLDEVIPEYIADVGIKKGEKVDFAVKIEGQVMMLVEAKPIGTKLSQAQFNQLFRYFSVTKARLAVLTNGREVWFFSDTDELNKMDKKPFFTFDLQSYDKHQVQELSRFQKDEFEIDSILEVASKLKYKRDAANFLKKQLENPDKSFVRLVGKSIHEGSITKGIAEQLRPAIKSALDEIIRDRIQEKLSITFSSEKPAVDQSETPIDTGGIVTTEEEVDAYMIIRAIGAKVAPTERIAMRDAKSYCAILMDNNNRRPICRIYFNSPTTKIIGIFDADKNESKHHVNEARDIYQHADAIEAVIKSYA